METTNALICLYLALIMRFHVRILCDHVIVLFDFCRQVQIYIYSAMQSTVHLGNICEWDIATGKHNEGDFSSKAITIISAPKLYSVATHIQIAESFATYFMLKHTSHV